MSEIVTVRNRDRFVAPRRAATTVGRARLDALYADATGQVLRVLAPGGYGKSTQIARWVAGEERRLCWIDLERVDNDPSLLASALARALTDVGRTAADGWDARFLAGPFTTLLPEFRAFVELLDQPFVLVLDDVHHIHDEEALALIDVVAQQLPPGSTLVLAGRSHPGERTISRHRLDPGVVDVTAADLALDLTETSELLTSMGIDLDLDALSELAARFEGWPAGLRLAGLVLRTDGTAAWMSPSRVGDTTYVLDYLRSEWTGQLPYEDLLFLREVACLERFTGPMCDEILGREGSSNDLRRLHRNELLVLPLDRRDEWFRMHPVLAGWLSAELRAAEPERFRSIHAVAGAWWEARHDIDLAFEHAVTIDDWATAEELVATHGVLFLSRGLYATVRHWLARFTNEYVKGSARLCVVHTMEALIAGDNPRVHLWLAQLDRALRSGSVAADDPVRRRATVGTALLDTAPAATHLGAVAEVAAGSESDAWRAWALLTLGGLQLLTGDPGCTDSFATGAFVAELNDLPAQAANCTAAGAVVADLADDRDGSAEAARRAWAILASSRAELSLTTAQVNAVYALTEARAGNRDIARVQVQTAVDKLRGISGVAPWYNVLTRLALLKATLLLDERALSRTLLRELEHHLRFEPAGNPVLPYVETLRASVEAATRLSSDPASALTEAELRVLQFLPTNLTLSDIATRLFVSRNTVKSHVAAIYRKLDTTSRTEAVDVARRAGVLDASVADGRD